MILSVKDVQVFWADALKEGFHEVTDIDVPFKAEGYLHVAATVKIFFFKLGSLKLALHIR